MANSASTHSSIPRLGRGRLRDQAAQALTQMVLEGGYAPGDVLPSEAQLGEMLGVSRIVVREAMQWLQARGLVDVVQGKGIVVREPNTSCATASLKLLIKRKMTTWLDLWEARWCVEPDIAAIAAERAEAARLQALQQIVAEMGELMNRPLEFAQADRRFHCLLAEATGNIILHSLVVAGADLLYESMAETGDAPSADSLAEHARIVAALQARDPVAARQAMRDHLQRARLSLLALLHQKEPKAE